ncbi:MAG: ABC transporter permease [Acholeplasmatales bacterium]|jgi:spermidine/putrescine transport system permease protein|nr:ABC transporter permease [Acholeplasmatales bacterium]
MKPNKISQSVSYVFIGLLLLFIYAPIISLMVFSFNDSRSAVNWSGFTLDNYINIFIKDDIRQIIITTFIVAIASTVSSVVIGTLASITLASLGRKLRNTIFSVNDLPIVNPDIVTAICLFLLFGAFHIRSEMGYLNMILAHIAFSVPYVLISVYPKVISLDSNISEAAKDLGANNFQTLFKVILPQIKDAIIASAAIAFTMSFDDFVISWFSVGDSGLQNISIYLYTLKRGVDPAINALTTIMIVGIAIIVGFNYIKNKKKNKGVV